VISAVARAEPGGVAFHCVGGRDRTGQVAMVLLALAGVAPEEIAADYALSTERLTSKYAIRGEEDQGPPLADFLAERGTTAEKLIAGIVEELDLESLLRAPDLSEADLDAVRRRLFD
jgi:protein tyrosine/serine phosphatase